MWFTLLLTKARRVLLVLEYPAVLAICCDVNLSRTRYFGQGKRVCDAAFFFFIMNAIV